MADASAFYDAHPELSPQEQQRLGNAVPGPMGVEQTDFVKLISRMITEGEINVYAPETFYKPGAYEALRGDARAQVDLAMVNIADLLRHIAEFYLSTKTPDSSIQLEQMINQLWAMKDRVEQKHGDILKF